MQPRILAAILVATIAAIVLLSLHIRQSQQPVVVDTPSVSTIAPTIEHTTYQCDEGVIGVDFVSSGAIVHFSNGGSFALEQTPVASGMRYANEGNLVVLWTKGNEAFVEWAGAVLYHHCTLLPPATGTTTPVESTRNQSSTSREGGGCYVGGCSGQLCTNSPNIASTCEWNETYVCYADARCERQSDGVCGWTQTPELTQCLLEATLGT